MEDPTTQELHVETPAKEHKHGLKVGDEINYVPHRNHAFDRDQSGQYPWIVATRSHSHLPDSPLIELEGQRLHDYLQEIRRSPDPAARMAQLKFVRPTKPWKAKVAAVNDDGTVDLDIASHNQGVTLHYPGIKVDDKAAEHHTCHKPKKE